jgi:hypothetical protein
MLMRANQTVVVAAPDNSGMDVLIKEGESWDTSDKERAAVIEAYPWAFDRPAPVERATKAPGERHQTTRA